MLRPDPYSFLFFFYNRRGWVFRLPDKGVLLARLEHKRCYVLLEQAASRRLAGEAEAAFPPAACSDPPQEIRQIFSDELCRYVDGPHPGLSGSAGSLRHALSQPEECRP